MPLDVTALSTIERRSKLATVFTVIGASLVFGTLVLGIAKLNSLRKETIVAQRQLEDTDEKLTAKKEELLQIQRQLDQLNMQLTFRQKVYSQLVEKKLIQPAEIAVDTEKAVHKNPKFDE